MLIVIASRRFHVVVALIVVCLFAQIGGTAAAPAEEASSYELTLHDIAARDELIAAQEALLNVYRCRFDIDTQVVSGGCVEGRPAQDTSGPGPFEGTPLQQDIDMRDSLIAGQEALLNVYRCQFDVDTQIVPGGCPGQAGVFTAVAAGSGHSCGLLTDQSIQCWGNDRDGQADPPAPSPP